MTKIALNVNKPESRFYRALFASIIRPRYYKHHLQTLFTNIIHQRHLPIAAIYTLHLRLSFTVSIYQRIKSGIIFASSATNYVLKECNEAKSSRARAFEIVFVVPDICHI